MLLNLLALLFTQIAKLFFADAVVYW